MLLFWIAGGATALLLVTFLLGDLLDFLNFDIGGESVGATAILGFIAFFGYTSGGLLAGTELPEIVCMLIGVAVGFVIGIIIVKWMNVLQKDDSGQVGSKGFIGKNAVTSLTIPDNGFGQIRVEEDGHVLTFGAKTESGSLPVGTRVKIVEQISAGTYLVEKRVAETNTNSDTPSLNKE